VAYLNVGRLLGKDTLGLLGATAVLAAAAVSLPRLVRLPVDAVRDLHVGVWVLAIAATVVVFLRLPHEAAYLIPIFPFGYLVMARYFTRLALTGAVAVIVLSGFVDLTSPGDEINSEAFTNARFGNGLVLANRETMLAQRDFVRDLANLEVPDNTIVVTGFVYPQFAVEYRDRLRLGFLEEDRSSISQLSDKGKAEVLDESRRVMYVWLLDYDDFVRFQNLKYNFLYTRDAGRSTAALYDYRIGLFGGKVIDLGRSPSGGSGAARTDR
jgi:hypothetical protein